jgi:hypothetical protein
LDALQENAFVHKTSMILKKYRRKTAAVGCSCEGKTLQPVTAFRFNKDGIESDFMMISFPARPLREDKSIWFEKRNIFGSSGK